MGADFTSSSEGIGHSVDISDDGSRITIGYRRVGGSSHGRIETYEWNSGTSTWDQMGYAIDGTNSGADFNISMSGDGNVIALANPVLTGYVEVYEWDSGTTTWTQRGPDINESLYNTKFGKDVALSENGSRLVVGESSFYTNGGSNTNVGRVLVYDWDSGTSTWTLKGNTIVSPLNSTDDNFGEIVDITNDGNRLVISSRVSHATKQAIVYTYQWNELGEDWEFINQFNGVAGEDFGSSVKLSNDGNQMTVGAPAYSSSRGRVYNYIWSGTSWTAIGLPVEGISFSYLGTGVTISGDGNKIASGEWQNNENGTRAGKVEIFHLNRWNYNWDVDGGGSTPADGVYTATVTGTDISGNVYTGTDSITFVIETTNPTVTLVDTDDDNRLNNSQTVTITAGFSEAMTATPVISISGVGTYSMTQISSTNSYTYLWDTSIGSLSNGSYTVTVSGSDLYANAYSGTDSITFIVDTVSPTVSLSDSDGDNHLIASDTVLVTATFSEAMTSTPTVDISGGVLSGAVMSATASSAVWYYNLSASLFLQMVLTHLVSMVVILLETCILEQIVLRLH